MNSKDEIKAVMKEGIMQCPNCQRENNPDYRFCIFCGTSLPASEAQERSEDTEDPPVDDTSLDTTGSGQKNVPRHQTEVAMNYVGFRKRLVASIIDAIILGALFPVILLITYYIYYETD